ncbi:MAG TPA: IPT/TIG domain-containing protein [Solirubrobacteraceae bacterium]|nr:IPT/TIG domain-containing protein [Solirubrobacteraceae bacterium]
MGGVQWGLGRELARVRAPVVAALVAGVLLVGAWAMSSASALGAPAALPGYSAKALCAAQLPPAAACTAVRLVPDAQTGAALNAERAREAAEAAAGKTPAVDDSTPPSGFLTPAKLHAAYELPSETTSSGGQTVAIVDAFDDPTAEADLGVYDAEFGLPACTAANGCFRKVNQEGQAGPLPPEQGEWAGEISLDVQLVHAICQNCHILLVEADGAQLPELGAAVNTAVQAGAGEVSNSYQAPEEVALEGFLEELSSEFYEHAGVVITASAGDCGYFNQACPGEPASAEFPASSPGVIAVGGTTLTDEHEAWSSTAWEEGGSGCSEIFPAPGWQRAVPNFAATGCDGFRSVADVAADANPKTGVDVYDSTPEAGAPTGWAVFGGNSVATPIIAAEFALAGGAHGVSDPAATLYFHAGDASDLYDVVSGSNGSCGGATSCQAAVGYDGPTGLGSPLGLGAFAVPEAPKVTRVTPSSGITGSAVTIEGTGLGAVDTVQFGALAARFTLLSLTQIEAIVPNGYVKGKISLSTPTASVTSKAKFKATLSVGSFSPTQGRAATRVTIKGVGFNASSSVSFDGTPARVVSVSAKKLQATVPAGAGTGAISVTNTAAPTGTVSSAGSFAP